MTARFRSSRAVRVRALATCLVVAGVLSACGGVSATDGPTLYSSQCARCHGGDGQGGTGPAINADGRELTTAEIRLVISEGRRGTAMPAFRGLSDLQVDNLVAYVEGLS